MTPRGFVVGVEVIIGPPETGCMPVPSRVQVVDVRVVGMSVVEVLVRTSPAPKYQAWQSQNSGVVTLAVRTVKSSVPGLGVVT